MPDASVASERLSDDRGVFGEARKSVWCFLLSAWSKERATDGGLRFRFGTRLVL